MVLIYQYQHHFLVSRCLTDMPSRWQMPRLRKSDRALSIGSDAHQTRSSSSSQTVIIVFSTVSCDPTLTVRTRRFPTLTSDDWALPTSTKVRRMPCGCSKPTVAASAITRWEWERHSSCVRLPTR